MIYSEIKRRIANPGERVFYTGVFAIGNEFGAIAFVNADHEQDALDIAVDTGKLDSERMTDADYIEYESKGWEDSYLLAGNASEPFWNEYLWIKRLK